ncbi:hypothetical protein N8703_05240 [Verrucomicrobia bacterium]|nr:hypothetical protein [Verrucomicrobiota bacterium]
MMPNADSLSSKQENALINLRMASYGDPVGMVDACAAKNAYLLPNFLKMVFQEWFLDQLAGAKGPMHHALTHHSVGFTRSILHPLHTQSLL